MTGVRRFFAAVGASLVVAGLMGLIRGPHPVEWTSYVHGGAAAAIWIWWWHGCAQRIGGRS